MVTKTPLLPEGGEFSYVNTLLNKSVVILFNPCHLCAI